jgi:CheY-like chemotaxis protein/HPt (histidine-containing phosphotransfer) domain-containing protein
VVAETPLGPEQRKCLDISRNAGENLLNMIDDIIDLSKTEACRLDQKTAPEDQRPLHILLVEDVEVNRLIIQFFLKQSPYTVDIAENGRVAVDRFQSGTYDLVLMDMQMPLMDGYDAVRTIRKWEEEHRSGRTAIIALTSYALKEEKQKSIDAGCDGHLTKPIDQAGLLRAIADYTKASAVPKAQGGSMHILTGEGALSVKGPVVIDKDLEDLVPGYLNNIREDVESLKAALEGQEYEIAMVLGHSMKGSGGAYGLNEITDIGRSLESAAKRKDLAEIRRQVMMLSDFLNSIIVEYRDSN